MLDRFKKISAVIFLTLLIWAYAYLALEETITVTGTLNISPSRQELLVGFADQQLPVNLQLAVKGPPKKITELKNYIRTKGLPEFFYNAEMEQHSKPGLYPLDVASFLNETDKIKELGISVESCIPSRINVKVEQLQKKWLTIQCLDENRVPIVTEPIEPASIEMFVHEHWVGDNLKATVILPQTAVERARKEPISEKPFVELEDGKRVYSKVAVNIKLPSTENPLADRVLQPTIGFIISKNLRDKFSVEVVNENDLRKTIQFRASDRAFDAYQSTLYQVLMEIRDGDENSTENVHRRVIYNFPSEFVRKGEIEPPTSLREAEFKLVPLAVKTE
jgi:hypothetical protein